MATYDNVTSDNPDTSSDYLKDITDENYAYIGMFSMTWIIFLALTLILGAISWMKIGPWRQFKNYVFLNVILSLFVTHVIYAGCIMIQQGQLINWPCCGLMLTVTYRMFMSAFANWVLIMYMVIYTKILKVFSGDLQHKYLKANVFAWGMAALECAFHQQMTMASTPNAALYVVHAMTYVIIGFYLSIMYALLKLLTVRTICAVNATQIINIFMYVTGVFAILILMQTMYYFPELHEYLYLAIGFFEGLLLFYYLCTKSHRDMWGDYMRGKIDVSYEDEIRSC